VTPPDPPVPPGSAPAAAPGSAAITIRPATTADSGLVAEVYLDSFHATYDFPLAHTDEQVRRWLADVVVPAGHTWVAIEGDRIVGMAVLDPGELDQLYVAPDRLGAGIGTRLLDHAKRLSPNGLVLYTFQVNERARRFYERRGFVVEGLGDGTGNEERQPDVRYVWRPAQVTSARRPGRPNEPTGRRRGRGP
jgi:GNAT superfamily N-acetyltransferase